MDTSIPNLRHLRVFLAVAQEKSITGASQCIFLSQPAITQAIAKLEKQIEAALFERHSGGMHTTDIGEIWYQRVLRALSYLEVATSDIIKDSSQKQSVAARLSGQFSSTQLKALIAVCEAQNFSIASRNLQVSQSSVHRAARDLERLLEIPLFEKNSLGIHSTRAANALTKAAKLAFNELRQGFDEIHAQQFKDTSTISVACMPLARTSILPKTILAFNEAYPDAQIKVIEGPYADLLHHLRQGDIDMILGALRFPSPADDVIQDILWSPPLAVIGRQGHPLSQLEQIDAKQLAEYAWVVPPQGTPTRTSYENIFAAAGIQSPKRIVESSSQILIRELLLESDRLTILSAPQVGREIEHDLLAVVPYSIEQSNRPIGICRRHNWLATETQNAFIESLKSVAKSLPD